MGCKVGLVILNYNDFKTSLFCAKNALKIPQINKIVIVDNMSTNNSFEILDRELKDQCDVLQSSENRGYASGNNIGLRHLVEKYNAEILFISNPDVIFTTDIVKSLIEYLEVTEFAALSGIMKNKDGSINHQTYWNRKSYFDDLFDCVAVLRFLIRLKKPLKIDFTKSIMEVDVIHGSFFAMKSCALRDMGFLDEDTFLYYEEDILSEKLRYFGYKCGIITDVSFIHDHTSTSNIIRDHIRYLRSKWVYQTKCNSLNFLQKQFLRLMILYSIMETAVLIPFKRALKNIK